MTEDHAPYYAEDTLGVHFRITLKGQGISAHVGRACLSRAYGPCETAESCLEVFQIHEQFLRQAALAHATAFGPETVILTYDELIRFALELARSPGRVGA